MGIVSESTYSPGSSAISAPVAKVTQEAPAAEAKVESKTGTANEAKEVSAGDGATLVAASDSPNGESKEPVVEEAETEAKTEEVKPAPNPELEKRFEEASKKEIALRGAAAKAKEKEEALTKREAELNALQEDLQSALEDPIEWAIKKGRDPQALLKKFLPQSDEAKRLEKLEAELAKRDESSKKEKEEAKVRETEANTRAQKQAFVGVVSEKTHPHFVALYPRPEDGLDARERVMKINGETWREQLGREPTHDEVANFLESEAKKVILKIKGIAVPGLDTKAQAEVGSGNGKKDSPAVESPGTLTNSSASQTVSAKMPVEKTRKQIKAELVARLEAETAERKKA